MTAGGVPDLIFTAAYLALIGLAGYAAVSALAGPTVRHWAEVAGLSVAAGGGLTALWLMLASLGGWPPTRGVLAAWGIVSAVGLAWLAWRRRLVRGTVPGRRGRPDLAGVVGVLAAAALVAAAANVRAEAAVRGLGDIDEYATWMLHAKVVFAAPLRPVPAALLDPGLSYSHQDYPPLWPLLAAGAYAAVGRVDVAAAKALLWPTYLALAAVVYAAARRELGRPLALAVTALGVTSLTLVERAGVAVAELPLTLFFAAASSAAGRWARRGDRADLILAGGFAAAAAFTKNEGLAVLPVYALATLAVPLLGSGGGGGGRRLLRQWLVAAAASVLLLGPWLVYRHWLPRTHEDYGGKFLDPATVVHGLTRVPAVVAAVAGDMLDVPAAGCVWVALAALAVVGRRAWPRADARVLWAVLLAQLGLYGLAFLVTPWTLPVLLPMVAPKLLAQATPTAALLVAIHAGAAVGGRPPAQVDRPAGRL